MLFVKEITIIIPNCNTAQYYIDKIKDKYEYGGSQVRVEFKDDCWHCSYDTIIDSLEVNENEKIYSA